MQYAKVLRLFGCFSMMAVVYFSPGRVDAFVYQDQVSLTKGLAHYAMGQMFDLLGITNRAALEYEEAVQYDGGSYLTHLRLGSAYARLDMLPEAIEELGLVHQINPDDLQSHYLLALIYSTQKEYDKAALEYELILKTFSEAEPQNIQIYNYLGQLYYSQKKYDQAIQEYEKIMTLEPDNTDILYLLGSLYWEVDKRQMAIDLLKQAIGIDPNHDSSLNTLGYFYAESNVLLDEAETLIGRAIAISPNNGGYLDSMGWVYYKKGLYEKSLELLTEADKYLKDPVIYDHIGDVYHKLNHTEEALRYWELSIQLMPKQETVIQKINNIKNNQVRRSAQ